MYQLATANDIILCTVLSQAKYHFHASAHPPILIVPWFCKVLHVTAETWQQGYKLVHFLDQMCGRQFYGDR